MDGTTIHAADGTTYSGKGKVIKDAGGSARIRNLAGN